MLDQIEKRSRERKSPSTTPLYQQIVVMRHYRMTPKGWKALTLIDKKILHYSLVMENHHEALAYERQKKELERQRKENETRQRVASKMPRLRGRR